MPDSTRDARFEQLVQRIDPQSRLLRTWKLEGGVSAQMTVLEVARPDGQTIRIIARQHGDADLEQNPHVAADEFRLLKILQLEGLAAPVPRYLDLSGEIFAAPCLVVEYVEGTQEAAPCDLDDLVCQMATHLAKVHQLDGSTVDLAFLPKQGKGFGERPANLDNSLNEGLVRDALESMPSLSTGNGPALLHGDFWPGNVLWQDGQLVAVIDWEDAKLGDPLADLANSRLEILWAYGIDAMHRFTCCYKSAMAHIDFTNLAYWDLCAALRPASKIAAWGLDTAVEQTMRERHWLFVSQALEKLKPETKGWSGAFYTL
jgi:aminoglycoside phosphotransferase (APT) family kinase protein